MNTMKSLIIRIQSFFYPRSIEQIRFQAVLVKLQKCLAIIVLPFCILACAKTTEAEKDAQLISTDLPTLPLEEVIAKDTSTSLPDSSESDTELLPIHGPIDRDKLSRYFPGITDTISDLRILGSEKIALNPGNGIEVSILHNTGTFDQMILCTHDQNLNLLDHHYIGKATQLDGKSHTIEYEILSTNSIRFDQVDYGFVKKAGEEEIDTVKFETYVLRVREEGQIVKE